MGEEKMYRAIVAWPRETLAYRLQRCRAMLYIHGYLAEQENNRVALRLKKALIEADAARREQT